MSKSFFVPVFNDSFCYKKEDILDMMRYAGISEVKAYKAIVQKDNDMFYCKHFGDVIEKGNCGKQCDSYNPKNGKTGCCKYVGNLYIKGKEVNISLIQNSNQ